MKKIWKKLKYKGFTHYNVSNYGEIVNTKTSRTLNGMKHPNKYRKNLVQIYMQNKDIKMVKMLHLIVMDHFKSTEINMNVWHMDLNGENNRTTNLENVTRGEMKRIQKAINNKEPKIYTWTDGVRNKYRSMFKVGNNIITFGYTEEKEDAEILNKFAYTFIYKNKHIKNDGIAQVK